MRYHFTSMLLAFCLSAFSFQQGLNAQNANRTFVEDELIIWLEPDEDPQSFADRNSKEFVIQPARVLSERLNIWLFNYEGQNGEREKNLYDLQVVSGSKFVQNNHYTKERIDPDDTDYSLQWAPDMIDLPDAWDIATGGTNLNGDQIVIAVIDDGFDLGHEDLSFFKNTNEIDGNGLDDDGNGYVDDFDGWNALNSSGNIPEEDHGTHVAGIAAATGNNTQGVCGVNWNVGVLPIAGSTSVESKAVEAYGYALEMRARYNETNGAEGAFIVVTNSSFGVDGGNPADFPIWCSMYDELGKVGVLSCAATANQNWNIDNVGDVPTSCTSEYLITVTNTNSNDNKVTAAGFGPTAIDIGAPGQGIHSTLPGDNYGSLSGTSMATPQVAGTIALMYSAMTCEGLRDFDGDAEDLAALMRNALLGGTDNISSLNNLVGHGRLNALGAVEAIVEQTTAPVVNTLPNSGENEYNYGVENENLISSCTVNQNGKLRVNHVGATGYLDGPNTSMSTFTALTTCEDANIIINSGGRFILGNDITNPSLPNGNVTRRAYVHITEGSTVHVKSGGMLRLVRGSRLIIEEGARLIIDDGAEVNLWWSDSKIQVAGELVINGDFDFSGSGYFQFDNGNELTLNADFNLTGQNINHRFIHLNSGATLNLSSNALNLKRGTVTYNSGSKIHVNNGASIKTYLNKFKNNSSSTNITDATALHLENPGRVDVFYTFFENLSYAVELDESPDTELLKFYYGFFNNNISGIFGGGTPTLNLQGCTFTAPASGSGEGALLFDIADVNISGSSFTNYDNQVGALWLYDVDDAYLNGVRFYDNLRSVTLVNVPSYHMRGGVIEYTMDAFSPDFSIGIYVPGQQSNNTNIRLSGNAQIKEQEVGIKIDKGGYLDGSGDLYGKVTMDCAKLIDNTTGIQGIDITLDIDAFVHCGCTDIEDAKPNTFIKSAWFGGTHKHFNICYQDVSVPNNQISAQGNFWSGGSDNNSYLLRSGNSGTCTGPNDISLLNSIMVSEEPSGCSSGEIIIISADDERKNMEEQDANGELLSRFEMSVYPNPSDGEFKIEFNEGSYNIVIRDVLGRVVATENNANYLRLFNADNWANGIYNITATELSTKVQLQKRIHIQN